MTLQTLPANGVEGEERFQLQLVHVSNGAVISPTHGCATIIILADPRVSGTIAVSPRSRVVIVGQPQDSYNVSGRVSTDGRVHMSRRVQLVRSGGKYGPVDVTWQILTSPDSDVFEQTEGVTTFHDLDTTADIYIKVNYTWQSLVIS